MKTKYDLAIGKAMSHLRRARPEWKPSFKRALIHLNVARELDKLGQDKLADMLMRIANENLRKAAAGEPEFQVPPVVPSQNLDDAIGRCMHAIRRSSGEEKVIAKEAMTFFNLSRVVASLGYSKLCKLLIKIGENRLTLIDPTASPEERADAEVDMHDALRPRRPAPPPHPNPVVRTWDRLSHGIKSKLDDVGIVLDDVRPSTART